MKMVQLVMSNDLGVRKAVNLCLLEENKSKRMKFRPGVLVDSIQMQDLSQSQESVKALLAEEEDDLREKLLL